MIARRLGLAAIAIGALGILLEMIMGPGVPGARGALMICGAILIASGVIAVALTDPSRGT